MPTVSITSTGGPLTVAYTISTPRAASAKSIDRDLPTVVFLHPVWLSHPVFHHQFADPALRRFNLIGLDLRRHGDSVGNVKDTYSAVEAVDDVVKFMEALRLPPVHLVGVCMGALIALELATRWPQRIVSLCLLSTAGLQEPADVAKGREEIQEYWNVGFGAQPDESALLDCIYGALQLGMNNEASPFVKAITQITFKASTRQWFPPHLHAMEIATRKIMTDRPKGLEARLSQIACPVEILRCSADIAYPRELSEEIQTALRSAGVDARLHDVPGAVRWGHVTHYQVINPMIHDFVVECATEKNIPPPPPITSVLSPFLKVLTGAGFRPVNDDEDDDDDADSTDAGAEMVGKVVTFKATFNKALSVFSKKR
ncbi:Alpha/Beta hydrolase protein [Roridomyces roridus]|uniref:Alpha/Beta hydrolase protein n=1 Tax=Roridomyces roridus TaxID=1738132 RepID=A0AAD7BCP9_9AGAR|nr:Alpha/Beta hydrolase protein [Roridomyces roridus]